MRSVWQELANYFPRTQCDGRDPQGAAIEPTDPSDDIFAGIRDAEEDESQACVRVVRQATEGK